MTVAKPIHTKQPVFTTDVYPWADLVVDLAGAKRMTRLAENLPPPLVAYDGVEGRALDNLEDARMPEDGEVPSRGDGKGWVRLYRIQPPTDESGQMLWSSPKRANLVLVTCLPDSGRRLAFVVDQNAHTDLVNMRPFNRLFFDQRPDTLLDWFKPSPFDWDPDRFRSSCSQFVADWYEFLARLDSWITSGPVADQTKGWGLTETKDWFGWFSVGVTTPEDRAMLEQSGASSSGDHLYAIWWWRTRSDMPLPDMAAWMPYVRKHSFPPAGAVYERGMTFADIEPYLGTSLDIINRDNWRDHDEFSRIMEEIERCRSGSEWTPTERAAVEAALPEGCTSDFWAELWTGFMPASWAAAYTMAGYNLVEAARLHLSGSGPDMETLQVLAGLRVKDPA